MSQPTDLAGAGESGRAPVAGRAELRLATSAEEVASAQRTLLRTVPPSARVVQVSYERPPAALREQCDAVGCRPGSHGILWVAADGRLGAPDLREPDEGLTVGRVNPHDLTGLAMKWVDLLNATGGEDLYVTFESISALLQYAETDEVYQLLQLLTGQIRRAGGRGEFYLHAEAHAERTTNILQTIFDGVRAVEE